MILNPLPAGGVCVMQAKLRSATLRSSRRVSASEDAADKARREAREAPRRNPNT